MRLKAGIFLFAVAVLISGGAKATTISGTIITNVATASYYGGPYPTPVSYSASYATSAYVLVAGPDIQLLKSTDPTIACSGGTVTFCVWARNNSAYTSAFNVILEDKFPVGFSYIAGQELWPVANIMIGYMTTAGVCPPSCADNWGDEPPTGQDAIGGGLWLKWTVDELGPNRSAMMCFKMILL
jgi:uncharacterized repeat protein (TIGR01451 family)